MFKVWYKSIFSLFLLYLLFVNFLFFTNSYSNQVMMYSGDYTNRYFGFNAIYQFFSSGFVEDSDFFLNFYNRLNEIINIDVPKNLFGNWQLLSANGGVYDFATFFTAVGNFFSSIGAIFLALSYPLLYMLYLIGALMWILLKFFSLFNGGFWTAIPPFTYA